jgi:hypothetical protein
VSVLSHKISGTMVEKVVDNAGVEDTVLVQAFSDLSRNHAAFGEHSVGAAIEAFEEIASGLFSLQVFTAEKEDKNVTKFSVAGKLLRLPMMIELGITAAIDQYKSTHQSIGTTLMSSSGKRALVEGNIVALYALNLGKFVRINGNSVDHGGGPKAIDKLPFEWGAERFLVVNAGNGRIAFYSPCYRRFLATQNGHAEASVYPIGKLDDCPRCNESFRVVNTEDIVGSAGSYIQLYCDILDDCRPVQVKSYSRCRVIQINGFEQCSL